MTMNMRVDAVIDCNLQIEEGECVIIYGDKGSGKTTLLNLLEALSGQHLNGLSDSA